MTPLVDTIERAFVEHRDGILAFDQGALQAAPVAEAIELYFKVYDARGLIEGVVSSAYMEAESVWGSDWIWQSGDVAERICDHLHVLASGRL